MILKERFGVERLILQEKGAYMTVWGSFKKGMTLSLSGFDLPNYVNLHLLSSKFCILQICIYYNTQQRSFCLFLLQPGMQLLGWLWACDRPPQRIPLLYTLQHRKGRKGLNVTMSSHKRTKNRASQPFLQACTQLI